MTARMFPGGIVIVGLLVIGCTNDPTTPMGAEQVRSAKGGGGKALHTLSFSGDIQATVNGVLLSSSDPLGRVSLIGIAFQFPATTSGNSAICDTKNPELGTTSTSWDGYASSPWSGNLTISRGGKHIQLLGDQSDGTGSINLVVNDTPGGIGTNTVTYTDARALISAFSFSEVDGMGEPVYDNQDRCLNFTVTAMPE